MGATADSVSQRLRLALDLAALGETMMRQRLRRSHPDDSDAQIAARITEWRLRRPGAEDGDAVGRPVAWPRPK